MEIPSYSVVIEMPPGSEADAGFMVEKIREVAYPRLLVEFGQVNLGRVIEDLNHELRSRNCPTIPMPGDEPESLSPFSAALRDVRRRVSEIEEKLAKT